VRPYGRSGARTPVATNGSFGIWSRGGREILLQAGDNLSSATVTDRGNHLDIGEPHLLFSRQDLGRYQLQNLFDRANLSFRLHKGEPPSVMAPLVADGPIVVRLPFDDRNAPNIVITNWLALMREHQGKTAAP
jgi:hypothetical protein